MGRLNLPMTSLRTHGNPGVLRCQPLMLLPVLHSWFKNVSKKNVGGKQSFAVASICIRFPMAALLYCCQSQVKLLTAWKSLSQNSLVSPQSQQIQTHSRHIQNHIQKCNVSSQVHRKVAQQEHVKQRFFRPLVNAHSSHRSDGHSCYFTTMHSRK